MTLASVGDAAFASCVHWDFLGGRRFPEWFLGAKWESLNSEGNKIRAWLQLSNMSIFEILISWEIQLWRILGRNNPQEPSVFSFPTQQKASVGMLFRIGNQTNNSMPTTKKTHPIPSWHGGPMSGPGMPFVARGKDGAWNPKIGNEHAFFCFAFFGEELFLIKKMTT